MADALPQVALPADKMAELTQFATEQYNNWKSKATPEIKAAAVAEMENFKNDPAFAGARMAKLGELFTSSDSDGDGRLTLAEF
mmetsp:Transcript_45265/g.60097  ORF Transcript_45265/g.60097 Transcript_45265/m.60097 type:complete len:83 (-) Transcript_45265:298-546(-)